MAIYSRDSFDCVWCRGIFPLDYKGYGLTLDHIEPTSGHAPENLVTCCLPCNSAKKDAPLVAWYRSLAAKGYNVKSIKERVSRLTQRPLDLDAGKQLAAIRRPKYK